MSVQFTVNLPETAFSIVRDTPEKLIREMRLAAAIKWYEVGRISQSKAAEFAGISRQKFLEALSEFDVSPYQVTPEELEEEFSRE